MKKISKRLYDACIYCKDHPELSLNKISAMFNVNRHSISKHKNDYSNYIYFYNDNYYYISEEEMAPVNYYLNNQDVSLAAIARKFKTKDETIKRRLEVIGEKYIARTKRHYNRQAFKEIQTEEDAYWLGFILADGYLNEDRNFLRIKLAIKDIDHLRKFAKYMKEEDPNIVKYDIGGSYNRDNLCCYIEFCSKELINNLTQYGLRQAKSGKENPVHFDNEELQRAYIRGMIDGDGHIEDGVFDYSGSEDSCKYLKEKFFSKYYDFKPECKYIYNHGTIFRFTIKSKKVNKIMQFIYENASIYLDRKYQIVQNFGY